MSTIDKRIVEMEFDNAQFEKGVSVSMKTLDALSKKLEMADGAQGLKGIARAAENLSLRGIADGVDALNKRFSGLGIAGMTVIKNLTEAGIQMGKNLWNNTIGQIQSGGKSRAQNLQQAKFMLGGLGVDWSDAYEDINYAVKGTAFGLDSAAMAASQLSASGVSLGEDMKQALGGISGVAAMTGSSFEDIARIFTTVAGNGRLMGDQLNQIGARGLNAAATLAEKLGMTEEEIRDATSKGAIDFKTFAAVMWDAYYDVAKGANSLTSGSLANLKAALSRIGEGFQTPFMDLQTQVYNALTPIIDTIKDNLGFVYKQWNKMLDSVGHWVEIQANIIKESGVFEGYLHSIGFLMENIWDLAGILGKAFSKVFGGVNLGGIKEFGWYLNEVMRLLNVKINQNWEKIEKALVGIFTAIKTFYKQVLKPLGTVLAAIAYVIWNVIKYLAQLVVYLYHITPPLDEIKQAIVDLYDRIVNSRFIELLSKGFQNLWEGAKALGKGIADLAVQFWNLSSVQRVVTFFENAFERIKNKVIELGQKIKEWLWKGLEKFSSTDFTPSFLEDIDLTNFDTAFNGLLDKLSEIKNKIKDKFIEIKDAVQEFFSSDNLATFFINKVKEWKDKLSEIDWEDVWSKIKEEAGKVKDVLKAFKDAFIENYNELDKELKSDVDNDIFERFQAATGTDVKVPNSLIMQGGMLAGMAGVIVKVVKTIKDIIEGLTKLSTNLDSLTKSMTTFLDEMSNTLKVVQDRIKPNKIRHIAEALLILTISLAILALIPWKMLLKAVGAIALLGVELWALTKALSKLKPEDFKELATNLLILSAGIFVLAISCRILGELDLGQLGVGLLGILSLMGIVVLFTIAMAEIQKKLGEVHFGKMMGQFVALAVVIGMLAAVVFLLGQMSSDNFSQGMLGVLAIMAGLLGFTVALKYLDKQLGSGNLPGLGGLIAVAAAIMIISVAVGILGKMHPDTFSQGLLGVMALLAAFIVMGMTVSQYAGQILKMGFGLLVIAAAMMALVIPIKILGHMDFEDMSQGILAILAFIFALSIATMLLSKSGSGSTALLKMAAAMAIMAASIALLGVLIYPALAGIAALTVTLVVFIAAGYLLSPVAGILIAVGGAVMLFGTGILMAGAGVLAFAIGIMTLVAAFKMLGSMSKSAVDRASYAIAALIVVLSNGVQVLIVTFVGAMAQGIATFLKVLADAAPSIAESLIVLGTYLIGTLKALVPAFIDLIGYLITALIVTINYYTVPITQSILEMCVCILMLIEDYTEPLTTAFLNILYNFLVAIINFIPELVTLSVEGILVYIQALTAAIDIYGPMFILAVKNLFYAVAKVILTMFDEAFGDIPVIGEEIKKATAAERDKITKEIEDNNAQVQAAHDAAQETMDAYVIELNDKKHEEDALEGINKVRSSFTTGAVLTQDQMAKIGKETGEEYVGSVKGAIKHGANGMPSEIANFIGNPANQAKDTAKEDGKEVTQMFCLGSIDEFKNPAVLNNMKDATGGLGDAGKEGLQEAWDVNSPSKEAEKISGFFVDGLTGGMEKNKGKVSRSAAVLAETGLNKLRGYKGEWKTVGDYANAGFASGLTLNLSRVTSAVNSISQTALRKLKDFLGIHSPSTEAQEIAKYFDLGLAIGIEKNANLVGVASENLGNEALDVIGNTLSRISDALANGIDYNPQITPVLNLDNLYSGMNSIDSAFSRKTAVMADVEFGEWKTRQNSIGLMNDTLNKISRLNSDNTDKTINTLNSLSDKIDKLQIVLDSGEVVGGLVEKMDNALGNRATYSARANM